MRNLSKLFVCWMMLMLLATTVHAEKLVLRVGHFPNITHVQGVIAHYLSRQGQGWFEQRLGPDVTIEWYIYNAGPSAMEAIFAKALDLTYVGPNPSINAYVKSNGEEIRVIAGAANGGAALVVQSDGRIKTEADFRGKKIATPQLGNTQDVACRAWLISKGYKITQLGGDATVLPTANPDQLSLFIQDKIDAVWTVEPWVSRLELEGKGQIYLEQPDVITTILVSSVGFLKDHRDLAQKFAKAHAELTEWILKNPEEAQKMMQTELQTETTGKVSTELIAHAWPRLHFTTEVAMDSLKTSLAEAQQCGFLKGDVDFSRFVEKP
jgi:NitT/TauT family transport system substrate-binding protein